MHEPWLAACIDCDGWIHLTSIGFGNNNEDIIMTFAERANSLGCRTFITSRMINSGNLHHVVYVRGTKEDPGTRDKIRFLEAILPFLIVKKEKAEIAIAILKDICRRNKRIANPLNFMEKGKWYSTIEVRALVSEPNVYKGAVYARLKYLHDFKGLDKKVIDNKVHWRAIEVVR